jgi:hypothetical protein
MSQLGMVVHAYNPSYLDHKFEASLGYIATHSLKKTK